MTLVKTMLDSPFNVVCPVVSQPRELFYHIHEAPTKRDLLEAATNAGEGWISIDFETNGKPLHAGVSAVGVGISTQLHTHYFNRNSLWPEVLAWIVSRGDLLAHNAQYDAAVLKIECAAAGVGCPDRVAETLFVADTFGLYMQLACEGFGGQKWGLKKAQVDVLGWPASNDEELVAWLRANNVLDEHGNPDKSRMCEAPVTLLGTYCCADADSCWQLFTKVLEPASRPFPELVEYHSRYFLGQVDTLIEAHLHGIKLDIAGLEAHATSLGRAIEDAKAAFLADDTVLRLVQKWREAKAEPIRAKPPTQFTKKGAVSKSWLTWEAKIESILAGTHNKIKFNMASTAQLRWLFYGNRLVPTEYIAPPVDGKPGQCRVNGVDMPTTKAGQLPMAKAIFPLLGPIGKILSDYKKLTKELEYVVSYIALSRDGRLHPSFRSPGTVTGRVAGNTPNLSQVPKKKEVLECFLPDDDSMCIINADVTSLENVVLAEMSRDPALLELYGPGSNPHHDSYLFNAAHMAPFAARVRTYYNPDSPTKEGVKAAKENCAKERKAAKVVTLAKNYGAGVNKIYTTLRLAGVSTSKSEVADMVEGMDELYHAQRGFAQELLEEWQHNGGWILNGIGRPLAVAHTASKDLVNRTCQSTGHDILMIYIYLVRAAMDTSGLYWKWLVPDWHDEIDIQVKKCDAEKVVEILRDVNKELNTLLGGLIPLKIEPKICRNLAEAKLDDYDPGMDIYEFLKADLTLDEETTDDTE